MGDQVFYKLEMKNMVFFSLIFNNFILADIIIFLFLKTITIHPVSTLFFLFHLLIYGEGPNIAHLSL